MKIAKLSLIVTPWGVTIRNNSRKSSALKRLRANNNDKLLFELRWYREKQSKAV